MTDQNYEESLEKKMVRYSNIDALKNAMILIQREIISDVEEFQSRM